MARYFNIQITEVHSDGPFTVYYDFVDAANIATLTSNDTPAENITRADLISATGIDVYIPEDSTGIILYNTDENIIAGCGISTVIKSFSITPTPTPTSTVTPTPTPTPTLGASQTPTPTPTLTPTPSPSTIIPNVGMAGEVFEIDVFGTSKVSIGGGFTKLNESIRNCFVETNSNGKEDTDFWDEINPGFNAFVMAIAIDQSTGTKFIGGHFSKFKNINTYPDFGYQGIVKLDSNGVLDENFNTNLEATYPGNRTPQKPDISVGTLYNLRVEDIKVDGTNVYIVSKVQVKPFDDRYYVIKTDYDGNVDVDFLHNQGIGTAYFEPQTNEGILNTCAITSDGGILVGGRFNRFNGLRRSLLFKLKSDGTLDAEFESNKGYVYSPRTAVLSIAIQSDDSIIAVGNFSSWNRESVGNIVKLASDGTYDTTFTDNVGEGNRVGPNPTYFRAVDVLSDDSIIVGGWTTGFGGVDYQNDIVKLSSTGVWDTDFPTNFINRYVYNSSGTVWVIKTDSLDNIYVGGNFDSVADSKSFNGRWDYRDRKGIVKLNSSGVEIQDWYLNLVT